LTYQKNSLLNLFEDIQHDRNTPPERLAELQNKLEKFNKSIEEKVAYCEKVGLEVYWMSF
jgi:hypothetical protein